MRTVFLDTGYVIALEASDDQRHAEALTHWKTFLNEQPRLVTSSYVFDEIVTFFNSRGKHEKAVEIGRRLLQSPSVRVVQVDEELFYAGWAYFQSRPDKRYTLTDCISFELMESRGIREALSFDSHFEQAGFNMLPGSRR